jgi:hypothetical protein
MKENKEVPRSHFTPKSYRIDKFFEIALNSCVSVYGKEKTKLFMLILENKKQIDPALLNKLPNYNKNELVEKMLDNLKSKNSTITKLEHVFSHERIKQLNELSSKKLDNVNDKLPLVHLRILPDYQDFIKTFSTKRLGEVLELAIALFILESSDLEYQLIKTVFNSII